MAVYSASRASLPQRAFLALAFLAVLTPAGCNRGTGPLPPPPAATMEQLESLMHLGLADLEIARAGDAERKFDQIVRLEPGEPAGWADRGLARLRQPEMPKKQAGAADIDKSASLAPANGQIALLAAEAQKALGNDAATLEHLRRAVKLDPNNPKARYALVQQLERTRSLTGSGSGGLSPEAREQLDAILQRQPTNLPVLLELARAAASEGDATRLRELTDRIDRSVPEWPPEARRYFDQLRRAVASGNTRAALSQVLYVANMAKLLPQWHQGYDAIRLPNDAIGEPIRRFLRLPNRPPTPAPPDDQIAFDATPLGLANLPSGGSQPRWVRATPLTQKGNPALLIAAGDTLVIAAQDGEAGAVKEIQRIPLLGAGPAGVLAVDWNNDFRIDLAVAGPRGFRLYRQGADGRFADVTSKIGLPAPWPSTPFLGVWAADVEADGDLDLIAGVRGQSPLLLRNNGDGTFKASQPWPSVRDVRDLAWADLDGDGDNDLVLLDTRNHVTILDNERGGAFKPLSPPSTGQSVGAVREPPSPAAGAAQSGASGGPTPASFDNILAMVIDDVDGDGTFDLMTLDTSGKIHRAWRREDRGWQAAEVAVAIPSLLPRPRGAWSLIAADFDNNGGLDLLATGPTGWHLLLRDGRGGYSNNIAGTDRRAYAGDLNGDGRMDLVGMDAAGRPVRFLNRGSRAYHWLVVRPKAEVLKSARDQRNNSFGIGGEAELLSAYLYQKRPMRGPVVHFGLGERAAADVLRVTWGNGFPDIGLQPKPDQVIRSVQRLKGSCPWLFADDGRSVQFVTDILWRSGLGLNINGQGSAPVLMTRDRVRVRRDQLAPRNGAYELRITAELWETHFFDMVALQCVDHPADTEMALDERFSIPAPDQRLHLLRDLRPLRRARDDRGRDVTDLLRERDGRYLVGFPLGRYQGLAEEHRLELTLEDTPPGTPLTLVAEGWTRPTDSSINVALSQGSHPRPHGLRLEVADGRGGWKVISKNAGFPAGKTKTLLIDLTGRFPSADHRVRLTTNMEIYWDRIVTAVEAPRTPRRVRELRPSLAELRFHGFGEISRADAASPEWPSYDRVTHAPRWRDLIGYYTRFGDVRELLARVDDRTVIMNAGDEIALRFPAPPPPPPGWVRDFVFVSDGWEKDGDLNTIASKTVLPLPTHAHADYSSGPTRLEDDPVYQRHREDWIRFHTRYVDGRAFRDLLRSAAR